MAEHTIENLDDTMLREKRHRESSFTSCDTEDEQFYSSPEDENEFLTRDFDTAYRTMCDEKFANLSKAQLTKMVIELEAQVEELNKPGARLVEHDGQESPGYASGAASQWSSTSRNVYLTQDSPWVRIEKENSWPELNVCSRQL